MKIERLRHRGDKVWFEYHCWEDDKSQDAELWHHSHQRVTIIRVAPNDAYTPSMKDPIAKEADRYEAAILIGYYVRFKDGFVAEAMEDELLDSRSDFERADPPAKPKKRA